VSSTGPSAEPPPSDGVVPVPAEPARTRRFRGRRARGPALVPPEAYWCGWPEVRADLRSSVGLVLAMALTGVPAGFVWWWLAPRADLRITDNGPAVIGTPSAELLVADDMVLVLVLAGAGLLLGAAAWLVRRRRGVATVLALALGGCVTGVVAWQLGERLGAGPTETELAAVGGLVTTSLTLGSPAALAVAPFTALLAYVVAVLHAPGDDLGRTAAAASGPAEQSPTEEDAEFPDDRPLVDVPPPGRPSA
jgi:LPXTG-motif cell wall-anchored protein